MRDFEKLVIRCIKEKTIPDNFVDIGVELSGGDILVRSQIILNRRKIHRLLDHLDVLRNS